MADSSVLEFLVLRWRVVVVVGMAFWGFCVVDLVDIMLFPAIRLTHSHTRCGELAMVAGRWANINPAGPRVVLPALTVDNFSPCVWSSCSLNLFNRSSFPPEVYKLNCVGARCCSQLSAWQEVDAGPPPRSRPWLNELRSDINHQRSSHEVEQAGLPWQFSCDHPPIRTHGDTCVTKPLNVLESSL